MYQYFIRTSLYTLFFYKKASTESNTDLTHPLPEKIRFLTLPGIFLLSARAVVLILYGTAFWWMTPVLGFFRDRHCCKDEPGSEPYFMTNP